MPVAFDNTFLALLFGPLGILPIDPHTSKPVERPSERIEALIERLAREQVRILIPTPALAEFLCVADRAGSEYLERLDSTSRFQVVPFDTLAAVEVARVIRTSKALGNKRGASIASWQKVKFDRQIVAIAKVQGATEIYSDDPDIASFGREAGITVISVAELPLPPPKQEGLPYSDS